VGVGVRRYRVKFAFHDAEGVYQTKTKEFTSLRAAGEFVRDRPDPTDFLEIRAVSYETLTDQEREIFVFFTEGKAHAR
jgi:hypothetical protein